MITTIKEYKDLNPEKVVLHHGSESFFNVLEPRPSSILNGDKAVFATNERWLALAFIAKFTDDQIELGFVNDMPYMMEKMEDAFDMLMVPGYLYNLDGEDFSSNDERLGLVGKEFIKYSPAKIYSIEFIDDVLYSLYECGIRMVSYGNTL